MWTNCTTSVMTGPKHCTHLHPCPPPHPPPTHRTNKSTTCQAAHCHTSSMGVLLVKVPKPPQSITNRRVPPVRNMQFFVGHVTAAGALSHLGRFNRTQ